MTFLLDLLYPPCCVVCKAKGEWWCAQCRSDVERLTDSDVVLEDAQPLTGIVATGFYHSPPLRRFIGELKYQGVTAGEASIQAYLREMRISFPWKDEERLAIVPMPLADRRERERGFNQAAWLASQMKEAWDISGEIRTDVLLRQKMITAQAELDHDAELRSANIAGAFHVIGSVTDSVLLVDDVVTTGSTAKEAARCLLVAGAPRVYLAALAVGK